VAALKLLSQSESELSLPQHLDLAPDLLTYNGIVAEGDPEPLMMAQPVPHQSADKKRVKVYELRNNDWFDRGTGFCTAAFVLVRYASFFLPVLLRASSPAHPRAYHSRLLRRATLTVAMYAQVEDGQPKEPRVIVESEDQPDRLLLETKICKEDGFQKQQGMFQLAPD
jgi:protein phosphatase-4 regulatory subunit 3